MDFRMPVTYQDIVDDIVQFTDIPRDEVEHRVWQEALGIGNVKEDALRFGITAHKYDDKMEQLYREGEGFIFETLVHWARSYRQCWTQQALARINLYAARANLKPGEVAILILGDGVGNDTLYFAMHGLAVDYFDVPGSKTYNFALRRFQHYDLLNNSVNTITDYKSCFSRQYDVVISFEVLEHLPDPRTAIRDIRSMLKIGGIALVTEAFSGIYDWFPTHLASNEKYAGKTPFLFLGNGMPLSWYSKNPIFKPMEFTKCEKQTTKDFIRLITDINITSRYLLLARMSMLRRLVGGQLHV